MPTGTNNNGDDQSEGYFMYTRKRFSRARQHQHDSSRSQRTSLNGQNIIEQQDNVLQRSSDMEIADSMALLGSSMQSRMLSEEQGNVSQQSPDADSMALLGSSLQSLSISYNDGMDGIFVDEHGAVDEQGNTSRRSLETEGTASTALLGSSWQTIWQSPVECAEAKQEKMTKKRTGPIDVDECKPVVDVLIKQLKEEERLLQASKYGPVDLDDTLREESSNNEDYTLRDDSSNSEDYVDNDFIFHEEDFICQGEDDHENIMMGYAEGFGPEVINYIPPPPQNALPCALRQKSMDYERKQLERIPSDETFNCPIIEFKIPSSCDSDDFVGGRTLSTTGHWNRNKNKKCGMKRNPGLTRSQSCEIQLPRPLNFLSRRAKSEGERHASSSVSKTLAAVDAMRGRKTRNEKCNGSNLQPIGKVTSASTVSTAASVIGSGYVPSMSDRRRRLCRKLWGERTVEQSLSV